MPLASHARRNISLLKLTYSAPVAHRGQHALLLPVQAYLSAMHTPNILVDTKTHQIAAPMDLISLTSSDGDMRHSALTLPPVLWTRYWRDLSYLMPEAVLSDTQATSLNNARIVRLSMLAITVLALVSFGKDLNYDLDCLAHQSVFPTCIRYEGCE